MADEQQPMREVNAAHNRDGGLALPPGFRFHPSDEEIITHYLSRKVLNTDFTCTAIREMDLNKKEPWQLPNLATMGEREWYFFYQKDRKYPTGMRANRATHAGYWKATGKDKEIFKEEAGVVLLIGMKKTLVFYKGRAPRGEKTNWVMHEYRLEGSGRVAGPAAVSSSSANAAMRALKDDWVVCRVFHKNTGSKKVNAPPPYQPYQIAMVGPEMDQNQNNIAMPVPIPMPMLMPPMQMQFPMMPDFTMDPYYLNAGAPVPPMMPPMGGIGGAGLEINGALFGNNPMGVLPPMPPFFHHQMAMGATSVEAEGFAVAAPESQAVSIVSQMDAGMSPDQASAADITSMMSVAGPSSSAMTTMDNMVDGRIWKY